MPNSCSTRLSSAWPPETSATRLKRPGAPAERAVDALILARNGGLAPESTDTTRALLRLAKDNPELAGLRDRYAERRLILYGDCFYTGLCEPVDAVEELIQQTADFIQDAQSLAQA